MRIEEYEQEHLTDLLVRGLVNDEGHHKQWYLEQVLFFLIGKTMFDSLKSLEEWEDGIAP
jgi:hypothetical protein